MKISDALTEEELFYDSLKSNQNGLKCARTDHCARSWACPTRNQCPMRARRPVHDSLQPVYSESAGV
jgi:hypothetical protein